MQEEMEALSLGCGSRVNEILSAVSIFGNGVDLL